MTVVHSRSGPARLERFYGLFISEVSLFSWNELPTELERPKRYVPDGLSQVPREFVQGTGSTKSAIQQEE